MSRSARVERTTKESEVARRARARRHRRRSTSTTGVPFFDHMLAQLGKPRRLRPDGPHRRRPRGRRPPHRRGHVARLRPGAARGPRRQGRHPAVRRRARPARRDAGPGGRRPVRPALRRPRRARGRRADRQLRHHPDQAHLGVDHRVGADLPARTRAVRPQRAPRRRGAVQVGGPGDARRRRARPAGARRPVHQGLAVTVSPT